MDRLYHKRPYHLRREGKAQQDLVLLYDGVYFSTYWNKLVHSIPKISYTTNKIKSVSHLNSSRSTSRFMMMIPACRHNKPLLDRPRTLQAPLIHHLSCAHIITNRETSWSEIASGIEEEADWPLRAVMAGSRGRWNARPLASRYGGQEVTDFVCTVQEQVIPLHHHHHPLSHGSRIYTVLPAMGHACLP